MRYSQSSLTQVQQKIRCSFLHEVTVLDHLSQSFRMSTKTGSKVVWSKFADDFYQTDCVFSHKTQPTTDSKLFFTSKSASLVAYVGLHRFLSFGDNIWRNNDVIGWLTGLVALASQRQLWTMLNARFSNKKVVSVLTLSSHR